MMMPQSIHPSWRVAAIECGPGTIEGTVQTSAHRYVGVHAETATLDDGRQQSLAQAVAAQARFGAAVLRNRHTPELAELFAVQGVRLPAGPDEWRWKCESCGHVAGLCPHAALVYREYAGRLQDDLVLAALLLQRGIRYEQWLDLIRVYRARMSAAQAENADAHEAVFRADDSAGSQLELPAGAVIKAMSEPAFWTKTISLRAILEPVYDKAGRRAADLLSRHGRDAEVVRKEDMR